MGTADDRDEQVTDSKTGARARAVDVTAATKHSVPPPAMAPATSPPPSAARPSARGLDRTAIEPAPAAAPGTDLHRMGLGLRPEDDVDDLAATQAYQGGGLAEDSISGATTQVPAGARSPSDRPSRESDRPSRRAPARPVKAVVRRDPTATAREAERPSRSRSGVEARGESGSAVPATVRREANPADALQPGYQLRHYELIRELGRGGMGVVWLGRDTRLGRRVAIKFLLMLNPALEQRFLIEARATAQCSHENIVVVHEASAIDGLPYMVLEFLDGHPLSDVLAGRDLTWPRAVDLMIPVARALVRAHEAGLVHRDLKPDNVFVQHSGTVKVLDFGIAKLFEVGEEGQPSSLMSDAARQGLESGSLKEVYETISTGGLVGTLPYMSPEQWGAAPVDSRTDLWAMGIMLFEMVTGRHPVEPMSFEGLSQAAMNRHVPMTGVLSVRPDLPLDLAQLIDQCLAKDPDERPASSQEVLDRLISLSPTASRTKLGRGDNPYPGLSAFQEADSHRFFGREAEVAGALTSLESHPLIAFVGPSGVGKSSVVRAGVIPALKHSGEDWDALTVRPGRRPLESLATAITPLLQSLRTGLGHEQLTEKHAEVVDRLRNEPGYLGAALRDRARSRGGRIALFVDQFEELYTLVDDAAERAAFTRCLMSVADDASSPLRVIVSMRSDLLDRTAEDSVFQSAVVRGLHLIGPPSATGLRRALVEPAALYGFRFEDDAIVDEMVDTLEHSPGALPLLQFAAARLWDERDEATRLMTASSFRRMGGIGGALARHADNLLDGASAETAALMRAILLRLVTPERTRAIADVDELIELASDRRIVAEILEHLAQARLIVIQRGAGDDDEGYEGGTVEIVHESLIRAWPRLGRWLDESAGDASFLAQLRSAAKQWDARGREAGLLWRGDALQEAVAFRQRFDGPLADREQAYLDASVAAANRSKRIRQFAVFGLIALLSLTVIIGAFALVSVQAAGQEALRQAYKAESEAKRARQAEQQVREQIAQLKSKEKARAAAVKKASKAAAAEEMSKAELEVALDRLKEELETSKAARREAEAEKRRADKAKLAAERAKGDEEKARRKVDELLAAERARSRKLQERLKRISTTLK